MIDRDRPVRVFRNWKHGCWSLLQDGVLCASARELRLADVEFVVRESGRERMLRERKKNVHAYAVGYVVDWVHPDEARTLAPIDAAAGTVFYDPYRYDSFVDADSHAPVHRAASALLDADGVRYAAADLPQAA